MGTLEDGSGKKPRVMTVKLMNEIIKDYTNQYPDIVTPLNVKLSIDKKNLMDEFIRVRKAVFAANPDLNIPWFV